MLPVVCGAQAAFVANPTTHTADSIVIMMVAQLMPDEAAAAEAAAAAAAAEQQEAAAAAAAAAGTESDAGSEVSSKGDGKEEGEGEATTAAAAAAAAAGVQVMPMRCVVQLVVRSSSHEVLLAVQQQPEAWVEDISQVRLGLGFVGEKEGGGAAGEGGKELRGDRRGVGW